MGKVPGHQRKMCSHKDSVPSLVPEYKVETLYSGTGTVPEFWRGYQEKRCVHIGTRRRIEPGNGARAPSVNTALVMLPEIKSQVTRFFYHLLKYQNGIFLETAKVSID